MKFSFATIQVKNLEESIAFYQDVIGLNIQRRFPAGPGTEIAFMADGPTEIELICSEGNRVSHGQDLSLGFAVDSMEQAMEEVKAKGIEIHSGPFSPNPKTKFFYVLDPNGVKVQIIQQDH